MALGFCVHAQADPTLPSIPSRTYNITSYGASTSSSDNTTAIQNTINAIALAGGGTVQIPSGTFLCGSLMMSNNVNLNLASGSTLKMLAYGTYSGSNPLIYAKKVHDVEVSGSGTIEGQGSAWWTAYEANNSLARPEMIRYENSTNNETTGIRMQNAPTGHPTFGYTCSQGTVNGITIATAQNGPNTDGIDFEGNNLLIENCNIADGDDNIALGAGHNPCEYITIRNCTFGVGHGCSIGSYTTYGVSHLLVTNCNWTGTSSGIRLKAGRDRGGVCQYLTYVGLNMTNVQHTIWIDGLYPNADPSNPTTVASASVTSTTPIWKHISFTNLKSIGAQYAGTLYGLPEEYISSVGFTNVNISATNGMIIYFDSNISFSGSTVTAKTGNAVTIYDATVTGISTTTY